MMFFKRNIPTIAFCLALILTFSICSVFAREKKSSKRAASKDETVLNADKSNEEKKQTSTQETSLSQEESSKSKKKKNRKNKKSDSEEETALEKDAAEESGGVGNDETSLEENDSQEKTDEVGEGDSDSDAAEEKKTAETKPARRQPIFKNYQVFKAASEKIRMLENRADIFSASQYQGKNSKTITNMTNGELIRRFYNEEFFLEKIEYWQIAASSVKSKKDRVLSYAFFNNNKISSIRDEDFKENTDSLTFFNQNGKIRAQRKDKLVDGEPDSFEIFTYDYDDGGRVLQEKRLRFKVDNGIETLSSSELSVNKYSGKNLLETSFYEDSVLRIRTIYDAENENNYIQTTYFDDGVTMRDFYQDGVKVNSSVSNKNQKQGWRN